MLKLLFSDETRFLLIFRVKLCLFLMEIINLKKLLWLLLLLSATLACSLSPTSKEETSDPRPVVRDSAPAIVLLAPQQDNQYALGATILLHAEARDLGSGIVRIEFYDHFDQLINSVEADDPEGVESMTATTTWIADEAQLVFLKARAFRADGTGSEIAEVPIRIVATGEQPASDAAPTATTIALTEEPEEAATEPEPVAVETTAANPSPQSETTLPAGSLLATIENTEVANIRQSPGTAATIIRTVNRGETLEIAARSEDNLWYATPLEGGGYGWVYSGHLNFGEGDPLTLPLGTAQ